MKRTRTTSPPEMDMPERPTPDVPDQTFFPWHAGSPREGAGAGKPDWFRAERVTPNLMFDWATRASTPPARSRMPRPVTTPAK